MRGGTVRYYFESGSVRESTIQWLCFEETFLNLKFRWLEGLRVPGDRRTHFVRFRMGIGRCNCTVERVCPGPSGLGSEAQASRELGELQLFALDQLRTA